MSHFYRRILPEVAGFRFIDVRVSWDCGKQGFSDITDVERSFCKEKEGIG